MNLKDLKFIQKELHEAYEMNDKILIGYAINRLDTLIFEETQQLQKGNIPVVSGVFDTAEFIADYERKVKALTEMMAETVDEMDYRRLSAKKSAYSNVIQDMKNRCQKSLFEPTDEQIEQASKKYLEVIWDIPKDKDEFQLCDEYKEVFIGMLKILKESI